LIEAVPNDESGQIDVAALANLIDDRVKLISITHVPTNGGLVNPAAAVGGIAKKAGIPFLLDACQSVGHMPIDVEKIGCDMLSATGRKYLRGPRGTGILWVRQQLIKSLEPPFLDLHAAEWSGQRSYLVRPNARRFESWESYVAGRAGLTAAIDYALSWDVENCYARIQALANNLRSILSKLPGVTVHDLGVEKCGIVTFTKDGVEPEEIFRELSAQNINIETSSLESTRLDMEARGLKLILRASVHYYNTDDEINSFCQAVEDT
jgi:selenocysteine lyase/cysteine desulfurase